MTEDTKKKWSEINAVLNPKAAEVLPVPSNAPQGLTSEQREKLFEGWVSYINGRDHRTWTDEEKNAIRVAAQRALKAGL